MHFGCALIVRLCAICLKTMGAACPGKPKHPSTYLLHRSLDTYPFLSKPEDLIPMRAIILFAPYALALLIPPPTLLSENMTLTSSLANDRAANISTRGATTCLPDIYGVGLNSQSCINAMGKIPRTVLPNVYGTRGFPGIDIMIPIRYQSDDGRCAITLRLRNRDSAGRDVTRSIDVADAAKDVIDRCTVTRKVMSGGSTNGFSTFVPSDTYLFKHRCRACFIGDL